MNYSCEFLVDKYLKCKEKNNLNECRLYFDLLKYCIYYSDNYQLSKSDSLR